MIRKAVLALAAGFATLGACAQTSLPKEIFSAAAIPDSLKQNAHAVVRHLSENYVIRAGGKIRNTSRRVVTLLDRNADDHAVVVLPYHKKFNSIDRIEVNCYNAQGVLVKKYHRSDFYDRAAADGFSVITDDRILALKHEFPAYPATIDISVETTLNSYIDLGNWYIQRPETSVEHAVYQFKTEPAAGFRYQAFFTTIKPVKTVADGMDVFTWTVKNKPALQEEEGVLPWNTYPHIAFALDKFVFDNKPGSLDTWKSYGSWISALNEKGNTLSPEREEELRKMTAHLKTDREKARFLYRYLQSNTRYVSVQLGIGGLKPFPATFVDAKKYGDCKALSNYMYALLKAVNIKSYYALVRAGENEEPASPAFPSDPFNHVILCIPAAKDTTWLECTSSTQPFGKLGPFTENRNALLITEEGGKLVNTPRSLCGDNLFTADEQISIDENGGATARIKLSLTGDYRQDYEGLKSLPADEQQASLIRSWSMKQPASFSMEHQADTSDVKLISVALEYDRLCDVASGDKFFYRPSVIGLWTLRLDATDKRRADFYFPHPLKKELHTCFNLPENFEVENLPGNVDLKFSYGTYARRYTFDADKRQVHVTTALSITRQQIPVARFDEMHRFMEDISRISAKKLVIRKKA